MKIALYAIGIGFSIILLTVLPIMTQSQLINNSETVDFKLYNIFGFVIGEAWLGYNFVIDDQRHLIVDWSANPHSCASYFYSVSAECYLVDVRGGVDYLYDSMYLKFTNWAGQVLEGNMYSYVKYFTDYNQVYVEGGYNSYYASSGKLNIPINIVLNLD
ncbi:MAG: hypothetical protein QW250_04540 [Sulfolobaceae archaeon]